MKIRNSLIIFTTMFLIAVVISVSVFIKINENHNEKLIYALETKVEYYAKRCYLEEKCNGDVTLKELYEKKYLTELTNPITKEIIDENKIVSFNNGEYKFVLEG